MPELEDRRRTDGPLATARDAARPVLLGTLSVRIDPTAERMAVESALEAGVPLIVANMITIPPYPTTVVLMGPGAATLPHEEDLDAVRAMADRAAALGIRTELLRVSTKRPVKALLELATERDAGLLVFGPDLRLTKPRRFKAAAREVRRHASCLVWVAPDG